MSFLYLQKDDQGPIVCPHCGKQSAACEWTTEYGDPLPGVTQTHCPRCYEPIDVDVDVAIDVQYRAVPKS